MLQAALERQIRPIYDALDTGANKTAIQSCNKILKKHPTLDLVKALKALAIVRTAKIEDSLPICDEVLAAKPTDLDTLTAMMHVLRALGRHTDTVAMFNEAFKKQPADEELGGQSFFANVRAGNWKYAQQVAQKMLKQFKNDRYVYWSAISAVLQANDPSTPAPTRTILYRLAHRLLSSAPSASTSPPHWHASADRMYVHLTILLELGLLEEARGMLESGEGRGVVETSLVVEELRRGVVRRRGEGGMGGMNTGKGESNVVEGEEMKEMIGERERVWEEEGRRAEGRIVEQKDRNWLEFLAVLDATFSSVSVSVSSSKADASKSDASKPDAFKPDASKSDAQAVAVSDEARARCIERVKKTKELFEKVAEMDGRADRAGLLGLLELNRRARAFGIGFGIDVGVDLGVDAADHLALLKKYVDRFGDKTCCFEDLKPYCLIEGEELEEWRAYLDTFSQTQHDTLPTLQRSITALKLLRFLLSSSSLSPSSESSRAEAYLSKYMDGLELGKGLAETELQPADDLVVLAAQAWTGAWKMSGDEGYLYNAITALEYASSKSKQSYVIRLHLIQLYRLIGAPSLALQHYQAMGVKQVQTDTLSHFILSRVSTYSLCSTGDITWQNECIESSHIYTSNSNETADFIVRAFAQEKYSQIQDFINFEEQLDNSLQRDLVKVEHIRMRLSHVPIAPDLVDSELIELKFIFDRLHHDNRDTDVLPNYQPHSSPSFSDQTLMLGSAPGLGWLMSFFRIFIRVFQEASDINEEVEEKVLIGDPPKYVSGDNAPKEPLKERLPQYKEEELAELTSDERKMFDYAMSLCDWLEPYHDYARPPPEVVLAEAAKLAEKANRTIKPISRNPSPPNGHTKKNEEPPVVKEAPEGIMQYFDDVQSRFSALVADGKALPSEVLHVATLAQEAYLIFIVITTRFKDTAVVKVNKLGGLSQMIKDIRTKGQMVLKSISKELGQYAEQRGSPEQRKALMDSCKSLEKYPQLDHDYIFGVAKKVTDAQKRVTDGVSKGMVRVIQLAN